MLFFDGERSPRAPEGHPLPDAWPAGAPRAGRGAPMREGVVPGGAAAAPVGPVPLVPCPRGHAGAGS